MSSQLCSLSSENVLPNRPMEPRFELLPFGACEEQSSQVTEPIRLTVTTSPKHGVDHTVDYAVRLRQLGHWVTLHIAARMVRNRAHLDEILERVADAGIDDAFVMGGDATEPLGPYESAGQLLEVLSDHPLKPAAVGIGAYPEGHPLIDQDALERALEHKAPLASYMVSQLCFDTEALLSWLTNLRTGGFQLPLYVGAPGPTDRRRLIEISTRIGVGPSLRILRKQRGLTHLFRSPVDVATRFYDEIAPRLPEPRWGIKGFHVFTFNELLRSWQWEQDRRARLAAVSKYNGVAAPGGRLLGR